MDKIVLEDNVAFIEVILHPDECADSCWLLRKSDGEVFVLFVDAKSARVELDDATSSSIDDDAALTSDSDFSTAYYQAKQILKYWKPAADLTLIVKSNSMLGAIKAGNYMFVFVDTHDGESAEVCINSFRLGKKDSVRFLGPFEHFYELGRLKNEKVCIILKHL
jgi:hypothetical protein